MSVTLWDVAADALDPPPPAPRRWATPGAMAQALDPTTVQTPALELVDEHLVAVAEGSCDRLMIFLPVQEGKSERCSRRFPAWLLEHDPTLRVVIVSHTLEKAITWGRDIRRDVREHPELGIRLRADDRAAGRWHTEQGGGVYCVGVGGGAGVPADVLIIDDPIKGRAEAESVTYRDTAWDWWENVGERRLSSRGRVVLMSTRWHTDDLAGRILSRPGADRWTVLSIPALAVENDPLGRRPGEELESAQRRKPGYFRELAGRLSRYVFQSVYQQTPFAAAGGLFQRSDWRYWQPAGPGVFRVGDSTADLRDCTRFITIDLATSTRTSADYTVAAAWAITPNGDLLCLDRARDRVGEGDHFQLVEPLRQRWLGRYDVTYVESAMFGTTFVYAAGQAGLPLAELKADADKFTRATASAALVRQHRVFLPADAEWLDEWIDEHAEFDRGAHDDQVDVGSYAARVAVAHWLPMESAAEANARRPTGRDRSQIFEAYHAATGNGHHDPLTQAWD
jgi:predicted phage terminase large subunit-like protein